MGEENMVRENTTSNDKGDTGRSMFGALRDLWSRSILWDRVEDSRGECRSITAIERQKDQECRRTLLRVQRALRLCCVGGVLFCIPYAKAEGFGFNDGVPERTGEFEESVTVVYSEGEEVKVAECEVPKITRDVGKIDYFLGSPVEASRLVDELPTFCLAEWHYWLLKEDMLARVQRQYAKCVALVAREQELRGELTIEDPSHPFFQAIKSVEEYVVPFHAVRRFPYQTQGLPPDIENVKEHIKAAIFSINFTVFHRGLCEQTLQQYRSQ